MRTYIHPDMALTINKNELANLINLLKYLKSGGKVYFAVDQSEIQKYISPLMGKFENGTDERLWFQEQMALTYLFEDWPSIDTRPLFILPSHHLELMDFKSFLLRRLVGNKMLLESSSFEEMLSDYIDKNPGILQIMESKQSIDEYLDILQKNYISLFSLLTTGTRNTIQKIEDIESNPNITTIDLAKGTFAVNIDRENLENITDRYSLQLDKSRPRMILNNFRDALAYALLDIYNSQFTDSILILISRTGFSKYPKPWPDFPRKKIVIKNQFIMDKMNFPLVVHPVIFYIYLISRQLKKNLRLDIDKTIGVLERSYWQLEEIVRSTDNLSNATQCLLKERRVNEILSHLLTDSIPKAENIGASLNLMRPGGSDKIYSIFNRVFETRNSTIISISSRFKTLVNLINTNQQFEDKVKEVKKNVSNTINKSIQRIVDLSVLNKLSESWFGDNPYRYNIGKEDFKTQEANDIYIDLAKGLNISNHLVTINDFLEKFRSRTKLKQTTELEWEIILLACILKLKLGKKEAVLDDCDSGIEYGSKRLLPLFWFIKNIALSQKKSSLPFAIKSSQELVKKYNKNSPRYKLQLGYLVWRAHVLKIEGYTLDDASKIFQEVLEEAKTKGETAKTCYRLALVDSAIIYSQLSNFSEATKCLNDLDQTRSTLDENQHFLLYDFTRAFVLLQQINYYIDNSIPSPQNIGKLEDFEKAYRTFKQTFLDIKSISPFVRKLCIQLISKSEKILSRAHF